MRLTIAGEERFLGLWRGIVSRIDDPQRMYRIKVKVPELFDDNESNWALPCFEGGSSNGKLPEVGQMVWVQFEKGDPNFPVWGGGFPSTPGGAVPAPKEALGEDGDTISAPRGTLKTTTESGEEMHEALPAFAGDYPQVRSLKSASGHALEIDDTPGQERIAALHKSGTGVEIAADGGMRVRSNRLDETIGGDRTTRVRGKQIDVVDGPVVVEHRADVDQRFLRKLFQKVGDNAYVEWGGASGLWICKGEFSHTIYGRKEEKIGGNYELSVVGSAYRGVLGAVMDTITGTSQEIVGNSGGEIVAKKISALLGQVIVEALAGELTLSGVFVRIGGLLAVHPVVLGTTMLTLFNQNVLTYTAHTHESAAPGSPTGPPNAPMSPMVAGLHTSTSVFVKP